MLVLLRNIVKIEIDNPDHMDIMKALNDAGMSHYWHEPFGIFFSVERMPRDTILGSFEFIA